MQVVLKSWLIGVCAVLTPINWDVIVISGSTRMLSQSNNPCCASHTEGGECKCQTEKTVTLCG